MVPLRGREDEGQTLPANPTVGVGKGTWLHRGVRGRRVDRIIDDVSDASQKPDEAFPSSTSEKSYQAAYEHKRYSQLAHEHCD